MENVTYTVLSPFPDYKWERDEHLPGGVVFTRLEGSGLAGLQQWEVLSKRELDRLLPCRTFLRYDCTRDAGSSYDDEARHEMIKPVLNAFLGFQVVAPIGGEQTLVLCVNVEGDLRPLAVFGPRRFNQCHG